MTNDQKDNEEKGQTEKEPEIKGGTEEATEPERQAEEAAEATEEAEEKAESKEAEEAAEATEEAEEKGIVVGGLEKTRSLIGKILGLIHNEEKGQTEKEPEIKGGTEEATEPERQAEEATEATEEAEEKAESKEAEEAAEATEEAEEKAESKEAEEATEATEEAEEKDIVAIGGLEITRSLIGKTLALTLAGLLLGSGAVAAYTLLGTSTSGEAKLSIGQQIPGMPPRLQEDYYGFMPSGPSGSVYTFGIPVMKKPREVAGYTPDSSYAWGYFDESKEIMGWPVAEKEGNETKRYVRFSTLMNDLDKTWKLSNANMSLTADQIVWGDATQAAPTESGGSYDGQFVYFNDEHSPRFARMTTEIFETDEVKFLPFAQNSMGIAVDPDTNHVYVTGWLPNGGSYIATFDPETHELQERTDFDGDADKIDITKDGKFAVVGVDGAGVKVFDAESLEELKTIQTPNTKNIHVDPTNSYVVTGSKDTSTVSVISVGSSANGFSLVMEPNIGGGAVDTTFDGQGNAYTVTYSESKVYKWSLDSGEILLSTDTQWNPKYVAIPGAKATSPDPRYLLVSNDHSYKDGKYRFPEIGIWENENLQLFTLLGTEDREAYPGPAGLEFVRDYPLQTGAWEMTFVPTEQIEERAIVRYKEPDESFRIENPRVVRTGPHEVDVYMRVVRSHFEPNKIVLKEGDTVTFHIENIDTSEDITHGFQPNFYDISGGINPGGIREFTMTLDKPGLHWFYCHWFCSALHPEFRARMIVLPEDASPDQVDVMYSSEELNSGDTTRDKIVG